MLLLIWPHLNELIVPELEACAAEMQHLDEKGRDQFAQWLLFECERPVTLVILTHLTIWSPRWRMIAWWRLLQGERKDLTHLTNVLYGLDHARSTEPELSCVAACAWNRLRRRKNTPEKTLALAKVAGSGSAYWQAAWRLCQEESPRWWSDLPAHRLRDIGRNQLSAGQIEAGSSMCATLLSHPQGFYYLTNITPSEWHYDRRDTFLKPFGPALVVQNRRFNKVRLHLRRMNMRQYV